MLTVQDVMQRMGVRHKTTVYRWFRGITPRGSDTLVRLGFVQMPKGRRVTTEHLDAFLADLTRASGGVVIDEPDLGGEFTEADYPPPRQRRRSA